MVSHYEEFQLPVTYYQQFGILHVGSKYYKCGVLPQSVNNVFDKDKLMFALKTCHELVDGFNDDLEFSLEDKENVGIYKFPDTENNNIYLINGDIHDWNFTFVSIGGYDLTSTPDSCANWI